MRKPPEPVPHGLVLFAPGTSSGHKRRRLLFLALYLAAAVAMVWPVFGWFAGPRPFILGVPLPMAWIVLWMIVMFTALAWLYRTEPSAGAEPPPDPNPATEPADPSDR